MITLLYTPPVQPNKILCQYYYATNGRFCPIQKHFGSCPNLHFLSSYKICTPTYTERHCTNGSKCRFSHFLPYNYYCCNYFLFNQCIFTNTGQICPFVHISKPCMIYNLLMPFKSKFINLFIDQIKHYYKEMYIKMHSKFLENLKTNFKVGYRIANFRIDAQCIICSNKVSDEITPYKRVRILLHKDSESSIYNLPKDIIKEYIAVYLLPSIKHNKCLFLRQKTMNTNVLQIYEKRYVRRDDALTTTCCIPRAIPDVTLPKVFLNNLAVTTQNLSLHLSPEVVKRILDRAVDFLPTG